MVNKKSHSIDKIGKYVTIEIRPSISEKLWNWYYQKYINGRY